MYSPNNAVSTATGNTRSRATVFSCPRSSSVLAALSPAVAVAVAAKTVDIEVTSNEAPSRE